jgi:hypothetical protein
LVQQFDRVGSRGLQLNNLKFEVTTQGGQIGITGPAWTFAVLSGTGSLKGVYLAGGVSGGT